MIADILATGVGTVGWQLLGLERSVCDGVCHLAYVQGFDSGLDFNLSVKSAVHSSSHELCIQGGDVVVDFD